MSKYTTPLEVGTKSEYTTSFFHSSAGLGTATSSEEIVGVEEINGKKYYKSVWFTDGLPGAKPLTTFLRRSDEAIYAISGETPDEKEYMDIPMSLPLGGSWEVSRFSGKIKYTLLSLARVEVPAGTFTDCLQVKMTGKVSIGDCYGEMYLCKGIGMTKQTERFSDGTLFEYSLIRYTPGAEEP